MADVRLTATNPDDSSVVPVAANAKGELLVADLTVSEINNDVTINGDLTVTGTINGSTGGGGSGLPEPYGPEGSVLTIQNGEPAWVLPPHEIVPTAVLSTPPYDSSGTTGMFSDSGDIQPEGTDWDAFIRSQNCFTTPNVNNVAGVTQLTGNSCTAKFNIADGLGFVFEVDWVVRAANTHPTSNFGVQYQVSTSSSNLNPIGELFTWQVPAGAGEVGTAFTAQYLIGRDALDDIALVLQLKPPSDTTFFQFGAISLQGWRIVEPTRLLLKQLLQAQASQEAQEP